MILSVTKALKRLWVFRNYTTGQHRRWWAKRKIDWKTSYLDTWDHPHRYYITAVLKRLSWRSLIEIGCGPGANLVNIVRNIPEVQVGGVDVNPEAIELAKKTFTGGLFKVNSADDIMLSDKATDVTLSDMTLIYVDPFNIGRYVKEMKRITRKYVVLCEFNSKSRWQRLKIKITTGYNAYDWKKVLEKHGFYDIVVSPLPQQAWPDVKNPNLRTIITAKVPRK